MTERLTKQNQKLSMIRNIPHEEYYYKLQKIEDIMEKYDIENVEELDTILLPYIENGEIEYSRSLLYQQEQNRKLQQDRDTWKKACELAVAKWIKWEELSCGEVEASDEEITKVIYQQAQKEGKTDDN